MSGNGVQDERGCRIEHASAWHEEIRDAHGDGALSSVKLAMPDGRLAEIAVVPAETHKGLPRVSEERDQRFEYRAVDQSVMIVREGNDPRQICNGQRDVAQSLSHLDPSKNGENRRCLVADVLVLNDAPCAKGT